MYGKYVFIYLRSFKTFLEFFIYFFCAEMRCHAQLLWIVVVRLSLLLWRTGSGAQAPGLSITDSSALGQYL